MKIFKSVLLCLALSSVVMPVLPDQAEAADEGCEFLIPPEAHEKAVAALAALGPERGGLPLDFKVLDIEGILSLKLAGASEEIRAALNDLGAEESETDYLIELEGDVLFDFDKWTIRPDAEDSLARVGEVIKAYGHPVTITGHTDAKGSEAYNLTLSKKRADAVRDWLKENSGIESERVETFGKGESEPAEPNTHPDGSDNPAGRQKNRRVEIRIKKTPGTPA